MRSQVVNQGKGVWANEVFGKFNDRGLVGGSLNFLCSESNGRNSRERTRCSCLTKALCGQKRGDKGSMLVHSS